MSATEAETTVVAVSKKKEKKLKPARKQVKPGDVEKKEAPQTGKEYSTYSPRAISNVYSPYQRHLVQQMGWW